MYIDYTHDIQCGLEVLERFAIACRDNVLESIEFVENL